MVVEMDYTLNLWPLAAAPLVLQRESDARYWLARCCLTAWHCEAKQHRPRRTTSGFFQVPGSLCRARRSTDELRLSKAGISPPPPMLRAPHLFFPGPHRGGISPSFGSAPAAPLEDTSTVGVALHQQGVETAVRASTSSAERLLFSRVGSFATVQEKHSMAQEDVAKGSESPDLNLSGRSGNPFSSPEGRSLCRPRQHHTTPVLLSSDGDKKTKTPFSPPSSGIETASVQTEMPGENKDLANCSEDSEAPAPSISRLAKTANLLQNARAAAISPLDRSGTGFAPSGARTSPKVLAESRNGPPLLSSNNLGAFNRMSQGPAAAPSSVSLWSVQGGNKENLAPVPEGEHFYDPLSPSAKPREPGNGNGIDPADDVEPERGVSSGPPGRSTMGEKEKLEKNKFQAGGGGTQRSSCVVRRVVGAGIGNTASNYSPSVSCREQQRQKRDLLQSLQKRLPELEEELLFKNEEVARLKRQVARMLKEKQNFHTILEEKSFLCEELGKVSHAQETRMSHLEQRALLCASRERELEARTKELANAKEKLQVHQGRAIETAGAKLAEDDPEEEAVPSCAQLSSARARVGSFRNTVCSPGAGAGQTSATISPKRQEKEVAEEGNATGAETASAAGVAPGDAISISGSRQSPVRSEAVPKKLSPRGTALGLQYDRHETNIRTSQQILAALRSASRPRNLQTSGRGGAGTGPAARGESAPRGGSAPRAESSCRKERIKGAPGVVEGEREGARQLVAAEQHADVEDLRRPPAAPAEEEQHQAATGPGALCWVVGNNCGQGLSASLRGSQSSSSLMNSCLTSSTPFLGTRAFLPLGAAPPTGIVGGPPAAAATTTTNRLALTTSAQSCLPRSPPWSQRATANLATLWHHKQILKGPQLPVHPLSTSAGASRFPASTLASSAASSAAISVGAGSSRAPQPVARTMLTADGNASALGTGAGKAGHSSGAAARSGGVSFTSPASSTNTTRPVSPMNSSGIILTSGRGGAGAANAMANNMSPSPQSGFQSAKIPNAGEGGGAICQPGAGGSGGVGAHQLAVQLQAQKNVPAFSPASLARSLVPPPPAKPRESENCRPAVQQSEQGQHSTCQPQGHAAQLQGIRCVSNASRYSVTKSEASLNTSVSLNHSFTVVDNPNFSTRDVGDYMGIPRRPQSPWAVARNASKGRGANPFQGGPTRPHLRNTSGSPAD